MQLVGLVLAGNGIAEAQDLRFVGDVGDMLGDARALGRAIAVAELARFGHGLGGDVAHGDVAAFGDELAHSSRPMPDPPPVTTASLPAKSFIFPPDRRWRVSRRCP